MSSIILSYVNDWAAATRKTPSYQGKQIIQLHWIKPPAGVFKVNVDGSLNSHGHIGAGGVMRDCNGTWFGGFIANLGAGDILQAEAWGMLHGLQLALNYGAQHIEIESDSAILVQLLNVDASHTHPLGTIISNCKSIASNLLSCSISHIHRERNTIADLLAKANLDYANGITWLNVAPSFVVDALQADIAGTTKTRNVPTQAPICSSRHSDAAPPWHYEEANDTFVMQPPSPDKLNRVLLPSFPMAANANDNRMDDHPTAIIDAWPGLHNHDGHSDDNEGNMRAQNGLMENVSSNIQSLDHTASSFG